MGFGEPALMRDDELLNLNVIILPLSCWVCKDIVREMWWLGVFLGGGFRMNCL